MPTIYLYLFLMFLLLVFCFLTGFFLYEKEAYGYYFNGYDHIPIGWNGKTIVLAAGLPPMVKDLVRVREAFPEFRFVVWSPFALSVKRPQDFFDDIVGMLADDLLRFVQGLNAGRIEYLIAYSAAGPLASRAAGMYPRLFKQIVLLNVPGFERGYSGLKYWRRVFVWSFATFWGRGRNSPHLLLIIHEYLRLLVYRFRSVRALTKAVICSFPQEYYAGLQENIVFHCHSEKDELFSCQAAEKVCEEDARLNFIGLNRLFGSGHFSLIFNPPEEGRKLRNILELHARLPAFGKQPTFH